jgi:hypothetical protein
MALPDFPSLLTSIRETRERIRVMGVPDTSRIHRTLAAEAARLCEGAGVTDSNVRRFAADILVETMRRR